MEQGSPKTCSVCEKDAKFHCARCQGEVIARYCSRECQRQHWPRHKGVCGSDDPCPLCLERAEDDGAHVLCFACGFASCESCKAKWVQGYCPNCKEDQVEVKDKAQLLQKVLETKPDHTIANYRLGLCYLRGQEGVAKDSDKALFHLDLVGATRRAVALNPLRLTSLAGRKAARETKHMRAVVLGSFQAQRAGIRSAADALVL